MGFDVRGYDVEVSGGRVGAANEEGAGCDREYRRYTHLRVGVDSVVDGVTVSGLDPSTVYCVRIAAVSRNGGSVFTESSVVATGPEPENVWEVVNVRRDKRVVSGRGDASGVMTRPHVSPNAETRAHSKRADGDRSFDGPFENAGIAPSARRGATLTVLDDKRYAWMFGGMTEGYFCDDGGTTGTTDEGDVSAGSAGSHCRREPGVNNDLWNLDLVTGVWSHALENGNAPGPVAREGHTAHRMEDGTMLVFGGKTVEPGDKGGDGGVNYFLGDLWELDVGRSSDHVVQGGGGTDGGALPVTIEEGVTQYFTVNATLASGTLGSAGAVSRGDLCIETVKVNVEWDHGCVNDLEISLYGPGPRTGDRNWHSQTRGDKVQLLNYLHGEDSCGGAPAAPAVTTFTDDGDRPVNGAHSKRGDATYTGEFRPVDSLGGRFGGAVADGEWTLEVYDSKVDGVAGTLHDWSLDFVMSPCESVVAWTDLTTRSCAKTSFDEDDGSDGGVVWDGCTAAGKDAVVGGSASPVAGPVPRWMHASVAVKNELFVLGGYNGGRLADVFRYDKTGGRWTELKGTVAQPSWIGRSAGLTRWGLVAFGGMNSDAEFNLEGRVWHYDMGLRAWNVLGDTAEQGGGEKDVDPLKWRASGKVKSVANPRVRENAPQQHYMATVALVGDDKGAGSSGLILGEDSEPQFLHFGGDYGGARNKYGKDLRSLKLRSMAAVENDEEVELLRSEVCDWRLAPGTTAWNLWNDSCGSGGGIGVGAAKDCTLEEVLIRAWCEGGNGFQTVQNV